MGKLKDFEEERMPAMKKQPAIGSGSHVCCVAGCSNTGTVALGILRADPGTSWKCSFHAWGIPCYDGKDWRHEMVNRRIQGLPDLEILLHRWWSEKAEEKRLTRNNGESNNEFIARIRKAHRWT